MVSSLGETVTSYKLLACKHVYKEMASAETHP